MLNHKAKNDDIFLHSRKMNACFSLSPSPLSRTKNGKWGKRTDFLRQNFYFVGRFQNSKGRNKNSKGRNRKNVRQNCINNTSLFQNDTSFLHKQAQVSKKRPTTEQKPPKFAIFKATENRVILNNFFLVRISALNGGVENVNKSQILRL